MTSQTGKELLAGSFGGVVQVLVGQPFDTVKVRLQTQPIDKPIYNGMLDCVKKTYSTEGLTAFYKGTLTPLLGIGACVSVQFGTLEFMKRMFKFDNESHGHSSELTQNQLYLAGAASGIANSVLSGPIEHIRTRLQVQTGSGYKGPGDLVKSVVSKYGVRGLFKGQGVTMVREFHGYGLYFATYEMCMQESIKYLKCERHQVPLWRQLLYGALAGYALWIAVYPVDVVKSKIQTDAFDPQQQKYSSAWNCAKQVLAREGLRGFYRGFWACMFRAAPVNAATFAAYECAMNVLGR